MLLFKTDVRSSTQDGSSRRSGSQSSRALLWILFLLMASVAFCQQGTITGIVVDTSGGYIVDAQVKIALTVRAPEQETQAGTGGNFSFPHVPHVPDGLS